MQSVSEQAFTPLLLCMAVVRLGSTGVSTRRESNGLQAERGKQAGVQDVLALVLFTMNMYSKIKCFLQMGGVTSFSKVP